MWDGLRTWILTWAEALSAVATAALALMLYRLERAREGARFAIYDVFHDTGMWFKVRMANVGSEASAIRDVRGTFRTYSENKTYIGLAYGLPKTSLQPETPLVGMIMPGQEVEFWIRLPTEDGEILRLFIRPQRGKMVVWSQWRRTLRYRTEKLIPTRLQSLLWRVKAAFNP